MHKIFQNGVKPPKVGINGFGRVGRCLLRLNSELPKEDQFDVVAIKDIVPIENMAYLLNHDSHYGNFLGTISVEGDYLVINGKKIPYFQKSAMTDVDWHSYGVNILVEVSGQPTGVELKSMIRDGLTNVVYGRNMNDTDITIVYGVDHQKYNPEVHQIVSASSCTGNAIVPVTAIVQKHFGIESMHCVSIHPVLSDQQVLDGSNKKFNLGRNALQSIIPVSSGISESLSVAFPDLKNCVTAITYRIPTSVVSVLDVNFNLKKETTAEMIKDLMKLESKGEFSGIIDYDEGYMGHSKVSIDYLKNPYSVIVMGLNVQAKGKHLALSLVHDNEWGYCCRFHDLINYLHCKNQKNK